MSEIKSFMNIFCEEDVEEQGQTVKKAVHKKRVPKIAFLQQQINARMKALEDSPLRNDFYTDEDGALVDQANAEYVMTRPQLELELRYAKEFLVELQLPVSNGWAGGHCCMHGVVLMRC